jgi:tetratricopeptide (TPR) repeat protein
MRASGGNGTVALLLILVTLGLGGCGPKKTGPGIATLPDVGQQQIEHVVAPGETLDQIADNYYGTPERAGDIARANGLSEGFSVAPGSVLILSFGADQWEEARRRAAALTPYNRGVDLMQQERLAEAGRQFELALATAPGLASARYNLALVQLQRGKNDEALALLTPLTESRPDDPDFGFARGNVLFQLTRFEEASAQFGQVLANHPDHSRAAFGLARSLEAEEKTSAAIAAWQAYLKLDSTSSWAETARRSLRKLTDGSS